MKWRFAAFIICSLLLVVAGICWWSATRRQMNILLISLDTTRADHLGCYGNSAASTPNLDRLASQGILFERAYSVVPITLPAHATIHTGLLPPEHGLRINGTSRLAESVPTLAEILHRRKYRTGAFISSLVLDARFGLDRGFEIYDDKMGLDSDGSRAERTARETISAAITWLNSVYSEPFFCWVHLYDPHEPYDVHRDEFGDRFDDRQYDGEIAYMDRHIGRLLISLQSLGIDNRTFIVIAGDHGEGLGEHEEATHGYLAYNSTMHVPLLMRSPAVKEAGRRVATPISLIDVFPTILDELRLKLPVPNAGRSLQPSFSGSALDALSCYGETEAPLMEGGWSPLRTWTTERWKYIRSTRPELYDLQNDPREQHNVFDREPDQAAQLSEQLTAFESRLIKRQGINTLLSSQDRRALSGLGYAGGQVPALDSDAPRRDIKDTLAYAEQVHQCMHLIDRNELEKAQHILEGVVQAVPDYAKAWGTLGVCLAKQENYSAADQHYRRALTLDAHQNFARIGLGRALFAQNRLEECREQLQTAVDYDPAALDAQFFLGEASRKLGRWEAARTAYEAATALDHELIEAHLGLAELARNEGNLDDAVARYEQIVDRNPSATAAYLGLGRALNQLQREADAIQTFEDLLDRSPRHVQGLVELARLLTTAREPSNQDPARAIELAEHACRLTGRHDVEPLRSLAAAYASVGRLDRAIQTAEAAVTIARESNSVALCAEIEQELSDYVARYEQQSPKGK